MTTFFYILCYLLIGISITKVPEFVRGEKKINPLLVVIWPLVFICMVLCLLFAPGSTMTDVKNYYFQKKETKVVKIESEPSIRVQSRFELLDL